MLLFAASGSGAMEAAVANLVRPGDPVLACSAGKFGERWIELADAYGARTTRYEPGWGRRLDPAEIDRLLAAEPDIDLVFATLSETSTGIVHDIQAIAEVVRAHGAMLAVDAVSGLGAVDVRQDEWGVDVIAAGSQKALMCPPGIALCSVSDRALERAAARPGGRYYFDFATTAKNQRQDPPNSPFTPPVSLLQAMDVALGMIEEEGLDDVLARHAILAPRDARRRAGDGPRPLRRPRRSRERRHRRRAARRRSTAARSRRSCATPTASPPTAGRDSSRARSCASPTPATSARSTSSCRSRASR